MPKKRKMRFGERVARFCELPTNAVEDIPILVVRGDGEVEIDGCRGILSYGEEKVVLALKKGTAEIVGEGLTLSDFRGETLSVRGTVRSVNLREDGYAAARA